jgi:ubiquinone/menaquinone biosynthesis C-methylase UbiE
MPRLMARFYDRFTEGAERAAVRGWRADLLADLEGTVVEVGAGTGHNLAHYPDTVDRLILTEPDPHMLQILEGKLSDPDQPGPAATAVEVSSAPIDSLPLGPGEADAVVCTLVLCSVPDPRTALEEVHRVLRPGGDFVHLEHVAAVEDPKRLAWQRRIEPVWKRLSGNCHLTRVTDQAIIEAGFEVVEQRREDIPVPAPWVNRTIRGVARVPA